MLWRFCFLKVLPACVLVRLVALVGSTPWPSPLITPRSYLGNIFNKTLQLPRGSKGGQILPGWPGCEDSLVGGGGGGGKASLPPVDRVGVPWEKNHERFVRYDWENLWWYLMRASWWWCWRWLRWSSLRCSWFAWRACVWWHIRWDILHLREFMNSLSHNFPVFLTPPMSNWTCGWLGRFTGSPGSLRIRGV